jgi:hypothetical protein
VAKDARENADVRCKSYKADAIADDDIDKSTQAPLGIKATFV